MSAVAFPVVRARRGGLRGPLAVRCAAFAAAALLAAFEYGQLVPNVPAGRELLAALAALAGGAALLASGGLPWRSSVLAALRVLVLAAALGAALAAVGVPPRLLLPWHWAGLAAGVGRGVGGLGSALWPYRGRWWTELVVAAGLALVLTAAAGLYFAPTARADAARRATCALAVSMLLLAGLANSPPGAWRAQGALLALALIAIVFAPSVRAIDATRALAWALGALIVALVAAPAFGGGALVSFRGAPGAGARLGFEWNELYGPITWPRSARRVMTLSSREAPLVRVTSLDRFDGVRFIRSDSPPPTGGGERALARAHPSWIDSAFVTLDAFESHFVAGLAGTALTVSAVDGHLATLAPDGTLTLATAPPAGTTYRIDSYSPRPTVAQLRAANGPVAPAYRRYTEIALPPARPVGLDADAARSEAELGAVHLPRHPGAAQRETVRAIENSAYGPVYGIARRLAAGQTREYDVVRAVEGFLHRGFTYTLQPPRSSLPLVSFLTVARRGYCQQFSGAMALLLRMDGIPARVGVGFKPRLYEPTRAEWVVRGIDAHAWTEVFFPGVGWVSFDPTPPEREVTEHGTVPTSKGSLLRRSAAGSAASSPLSRLAALTPSSRARSGHRLTWVGFVAICAALAAALSVLAAWALAGRRLARALRRPGSELVAEISDWTQRATPAGSPAATLSSLAAGLDGRRDVRAAAYLQALSLARYGAQPAAGPTAAGREALRRALGRGRGLRTRLMLLVTMPPLALRPRRRRGR